MARTHKTVVVDVVRVAGEIESRKLTGDGPFLLKSLQKIVGGYVESTQCLYKGERRTMLQNEYGKRANLTMNKIATEAYQKVYGPVDIIVGDVAIIMEGKL